MKDNEISLELAARVARFAKETKRTFREAFQYLISRAAQEDKPKCVFISHHGREAEAMLYLMLGAILIHWASDGTFFVDLWRGPQK